jgi:hypothetical protein
LSNFKAFLSIWGTISCENTRGDTIACSATRPGSFQHGKASVTVEEEELIKGVVDYTATQRTEVFT